jgi:uncharacterized MAPEG superfamily protein
MRFVIVCIAIAAVLPFLWVGLTAWPSRTTLSRWGSGWNNHDVRGSADRLQGWRRRAHLAQQNAHEAFAPFAAALVLAQLAHAPDRWVQPLTVGFLALRGLHGLSYVADRAFLRSTIWSVGAAVVLGLFAVAWIGA